ncbi:Pre-mRNA-splicing factor CWC21 [Diplonema papillatum]|nr:Pre-mRNA-splicing factor CWC21 [Diplonema papillatum]
MYNGVGLRTPRGSGTSGFIQRNAGQLAQGGGRTALMWNTRSYYKADVIQQEKGKDIVEHERKRAIELKLLIAREKMEDEAKMTEDEIEDELVYLRRVYEREQEEEVKQDEAKPTKSLSDFAKAFKIDETYKEGESFDRELQVAGFVLVQVQGEVRLYTSLKERNNTRNTNDRKEA